MKCNIHEDLSIGRLTPSHLPGSGVFPASSVCAPVWLPGAWAAMWWMRLEPSRDAGLREGSRPVSGTGRHLRSDAFEDPGGQV